MNKKLLDAAGTGNVKILIELIEHDPCILGSVALADTDTPLHIACLGGHHEFVKMLLNLRPQFCRELNQDGFSPLHIASANGHVEIVRELLNLSPALCLLKGRDGRLPLHYAAIKGRVEVIAELLVVNSDCIADVTARGETALHLAVKNNQFESFRVLMDHLKQNNSGHDALNKKDGQGNTILHLAVSRKQYEVVELVVGENAADVNALNQKGLTPLDVLGLSFESEAGDGELEQMLRQAGAKQGRDLDESMMPVTSQNQTNRHHQTQSTITGHMHTHALLRTYKQARKYLKYQKIKDAPAEARNILLVVAVLIATATYQAQLSPPGGLWQDDGGDQWHVAGTSILGTKNCVAHCLLLFFNSVGFVTSLHMINILTVGFHLRLELLLSNLSLLFTYYLSMLSITPPKTGVFFLDSIVFILTALPVGTFLLLHVPRTPQPPQQTN